MQVSEFHSLLKSAGSYRTPSNPPRTRLDRLLGWSDARYYGGLLSLVISGNLAARRNRFDTAAWAEHAMRALRLIERCGGRVEIAGFDNMVSRREPAVYVCNHMSLLETFLLPGLLMPDRVTVTVVKKSLLRYPLFGRVLVCIPHIAVGREDARADLEKILREGADAMRSGKSLLIFPQATRMLWFDPAAFNSMGVKVARRAGVPVCPIAVATDFMGMGFLAKELGPIHRERPVRIRFGAPVPVRGAGRDAHALVLDFIGKNLREWGVEVRN